MSGSTIPAIIVENLEILREFTVGAWQSLGESNPSSQIENLVS